MQLPAHSSAQLVFRHPDARTSRLDRYAWLNVDRAEARDVTARLRPKDLLDALTDDDLERLFRRSMGISAASDPLIPPVTHSA
jgi:hypothetical protein